jgi:hypothetical protein
MDVAGWSAHSGWCVPCMTLSYSQQHHRLTRKSRIAGRLRLFAPVIFLSILGVAALQAQAPAYPASGWQGRLSPDDQRQFDKDYAKWVDATRKNDQDDIANNARKMQEIMVRYNIPPSVPFAEIASGGYAVGYPSAPYGYPYAQPQRLSSHDQHNFDKAYKKWVEARRKRDQDDIDKNAHKMQDIMARYNIPANVRFDQIASPGAAYR